MLTDKSDLCDTSRERVSWKWSRWLGWLKANELWGRQRKTFMDWLSFACGDQWKVNDILKICHERNEHILIAKVRVWYGTYIGLLSVTATNTHQYSVRMRHQLKICDWDQLRSLYALGLSPYLLYLKWTYRPIPSCFEGQWASVPSLVLELKCGKLCF